MAKMEELEGLDMFKSLHNKQLLSLVVLSAAVCSLALAAAPVGAQPGDNGEPNHDVFGTTGDESITGAGSGQVEPFNTEELEDLVAPIALYPDELLAIVLPATAYPLQIVLAARFLEQLEKDDSLQPDEGLGRVGSRLAQLSRSDRFAEQRPGVDLATGRSRY